MLKYAPLTTNTWHLPSLFSKGDPQPVKRGYLALSEEKGEPCRGPTYVGKIRGRIA